MKKYAVHFIIDYKKGQLKACLFSFGDARENGKED